VQASKDEEEIGGEKSMVRKGKGGIIGTKNQPSGTRYFNGEPFTVFGRAAKTKSEAKRLADEFRKEGFCTRIVRGSYEYPLNQKSKKGMYWYIYVNTNRKKRR